MPHKYTRIALRATKRIVSNQNLSHGHLTHRYLIDLDLPTALRTIYTSRTSKPHHWTHHCCLLSNSRHIICQVQYTTLLDSPSVCHSIISGDFHSITPQSNSLILILAPHHSWQLQLVHLLNLCVSAFTDIYLIQMRHMFKYSGSAIYAHTSASSSLEGLMQARQPSLRRFVV